MQSGAWGRPVSGFQTFLKPSAGSLMADVFTRAKRSHVMSRIRPNGNKGTELAMVAFFRENRITGWRRQQPLFGKPDFVFRKNRIALFVDGCFWHGCPEHGTKPKTNTEFWAKKIQRNKDRDRLVNSTLSAAGWQVVRVWEHELRKKNVGRLSSRLMKKLLALSNSDAVQDQELGLERLSPSPLD
jgi:DNA mismatch endonuclease (patch repair protein)